MDTKQITVVKKWNIFVNFVLYTYIHSFVLFIYWSSEDQLWSSEDYLSIVHHVKFLKK